MFDELQFEIEFERILKLGYLPVIFHTHPVKGHNFNGSLYNSNFKSDTSMQDQKESHNLYLVGEKWLLMPRALIVGNDIYTREIFIGIYSGLIAPLDFEQSKMKIQQEQTEKIARYFSEVDLSNEQKFGLALGGALLLYIIIKYPKYSIPILVGIAAIIPLLITNTQNIENPNYFNRLSEGNANIYVPNVKLEQ